MRISRNLEEAAEALPDGDTGARAHLDAMDACEDVRCGCGSLLARVIEGAVELKCRRCKRVWRLPVDGAPRVLHPGKRFDAR